MSTQPENIPADNNFRDGRTITVGAIVGSLLIAAGCFGGVFTAFEIDVTNWESKVWFRFGFVFLFFFAGIFVIVASILRPWRMLLIAGLFSAAIAFVVAFFPSGAQLFAGPDTYVGTIESIVVPHEVMKTEVKPMSGTTSARQGQPRAIVTLLLDSGEKKVLKIGCRDLANHLGTETYNLSEPRNGTWKLLYLHYLDRVLTLEQE